MDVSKIIKDPGIWAGQNKPGLPIEEADILVFSIPFDGGVSFRSGACDAPKAIREITYTIPPTTENFESFEGIKVLDLGDVEGKDRNELFLNAKSTASSAVKAGKFFTMIGGDHSVTIPVQSGVDEALNEPFGIIHIDAHCDLCNEMNGDKYSHGSTERRAIELENINGPDSLYFLGIRSVETDELDFIRENRINILSAKSIHVIGLGAAVQQVKEHFKGIGKIYLTIDIDCLDPGFAPGTGTPQFGGLSSRDLLTLLEGIFDLPIIGMDIVEVAPKLESSIVAVFAA